MLAGNQFMPKIHLNQPGTTYSLLPDHLLKRKKKKIKETLDSRYIYQNELDNNCFQHDMAHGDFKDSTRRTASDKILLNKAFNIAKL